METARNACLRLPEVEEFDHFGKPAYRVRKKVMATLWLDQKRMVLKFAREDQESFCSKFASVFFPVSGAWGKYGWTNLQLDKASGDIFSVAIRAAWRNIAPKTLAKKHPEADLLRRSLQDDKAP